MGSDLRTVLARVRLLKFARAARAGVRAAKQSLDPTFEPREDIDNEHLRLLCAFLLAADANCIDVGANEGGMLADFSTLAPNGRHIAFEPLPHLYEGLVTQYPDVDVRNVALSDHSGTATFTHVKTLSGYSGFRPRTYPAPQDLEEIEVRVDTLDDSLPPGYHPTLIKIDVEGAELQVLRGGLRTIAEHKPIIVFEHGLGAADHYGTTPTDVHDLLCKEAGLRVFDLDGNGPYERGSFEEAFYANRCWNFVAHR
jgi:FkbM family methyltransferase